MKSKMVTFHLGAFFPFIHSFRIGIKTISRIYFLCCVVFCALFFHFVVIVGAAHERTNHHVTLTFFCCFSWCFSLSSSSLSLSFYLFFSCFAVVVLSVAACDSNSKALSNVKMETEIRISIIFTFRMQCDSGNVVM